MYFTDTTFNSWKQGDLNCVEELLTEEIAHPLNSFHHSCALANRALVRTRLKQLNMAIDDAKKVILGHLLFHLC